MSPAFQEKALRWLFLVILLVFDLAAIIYICVYFKGEVNAQPRPILNWDAEERGDLRQSRQYNEEGAKLFSSGRFLEAAEKFENAYRVYPNSKAAFNTALAYEAGNDLKKAIDWYQIYLKDKKLPEKEREAVKTKITELEKSLLAAEERRKQEEARKIVLEKKAEKKAEKKEEKRPDTKELEIKDLRVVKKEMVLIQERPYKPWKWVATGGTVVFLATAITLNLLAVSQANDAQRYYLDNYDQYHSKYSNAKTKQRISYFFYSLTGVAAVASGVLWYLDFRDAKKELKPQERKVSFLPLFNQDSLGAGVFVRF